ncbi:MAG: hypothetical protein AB1422_00115 [bacterium]
MRDNFNKKGLIPKILMILGIILLILSTVLFFFKEDMFLYFKTIIIHFVKGFDPSAEREIYPILIFLIFQMISLGVICLYLGVLLRKFTFKNLFEIQLPEDKKFLEIGRERFFKKYLKWFYPLFLSVVVIIIAIFLPVGLEKDDPYIIFRYVNNILSGQGWVYNLGEHINGTTSTLNTILYVIGSFFYKDIPLAARVINTISLFFASYFLFLIFYNKKRILGGIISSVFITINPYLIQSYGLESMLYLMLMILSLYFYEKNKLMPMGICLALLYLTRGDGIILAIVLYGIYSINSKKIPFKSLVLFGLILLPFLLFLYLYFGSITPNTLYAKICQGKAGYWKLNFCGGIFYEIDYYLRKDILVLLLTVPFFFGILHLYQKRLLDISIFMWMILYYTAYSLLNVPPYHQYYIPLFLPTGYFLGLGCEWLIFNPYLRTKLLRIITFFLILLIVIFPLIKIDYKEYKSLPSEYYLQYREVGLWLKRNTPQNVSVAAVEIGIVGYYSQRRMVDICGLVMPREIAYHLMKQDMTYWFYKYKPNYIIFHDKESVLFKKFEKPITNLKTFKDSYVKIKEFDSPGDGKIFIYQKTS